MMGGRNRNMSVWKFTGQPANLTYIMRPQGYEREITSNKKWKTPEVL